MKWTFLLILIFSFSIGYGQNEIQKLKPEETEVWSPVPPIVMPGSCGQPSSDAIILFDGSHLDAWCTPTHPDDPGELKDVLANARTASVKGDRVSAPWHLVDGEIEVVPGKGAMESKQSFGSIQMHIEWMPPVDAGKKGQDYSNSGIFLMGLYELQILNSYANETYSNGMASAVYKQHIPLVNAANPPGNWQSYDIIFDAPQFGTDGELIKPAYLTVFWNGVLVQNHVELKGPTLYIGKPGYFGHSQKLPIRLQDHGNKVRYRNIWVREL